MRMHKRRSAVVSRGGSFSGMMEELESRQMLDGASNLSRFQGSPLDWRGYHFDNWSRGSWVITFNQEQSRSQADARARQVATALGVSPLQVTTSALGKFASILVG